MTAAIIQLDDHRRKVPEVLVCLFCCAEGPARVVPHRPYYACPGQPGCEETAAVPFWKTGWRPST